MVPPLLINVAEPHRLADWLVPGSWVWREKEGRNRQKKSLLIVLPVGFKSEIDMMKNDDDHHDDHGDQFVIGDNNNSARSQSHRVI